MTRAGRLDTTTLARVLAARLGEHTVDAPPPDLPPASGAAFDSRRVRPGDVFFALRGQRQHGHAFAGDALAGGAAFVVSDQPHPRGMRVTDPAAALLALGRWARDAHRGPVIGVSGSAGKTTAKALLAAALEARATSGNLNTPYALAAALLDATLAGDGDRVLVLELGIDHVGEMATLLDLVRPTHGLLTLIDAAHLQGLGDLAGVAREKGLLLRAASGGRYAAAAAWDRLEPDLRAATTRYGLDQDRAPSGRHLPGPDADRLEARLGDDAAPVTLRLPGLGAALAEHALGALVLARDLGADPRAAADRIAAARLEPGRLQRHAVDGLTLLDDSYNANPASMRLALDVLAGLPAPHAAVLGDMRELGPAAAEHHRALFERARALDTLWAVGPESSAAAAAVAPQARRYPDVEAALRDVAALPRSGSVLVKGSRGVALERLVYALLARDAATEART
jgi:UDP-N-acetylmuramoyl-tripeptide--D-alanyl-D-alanine ligase